MEFQSQTPLPLLPYRKEERYRRMSMGVVVRNTLLFWGISLSRGDIAFRRIRIWLERFEILGSLLFGVGFLGLFVWAVSVQGSTSSEILSFDFSSMRGDNAILIIDEIYGRSAEQFSIEYVACMVFSYGMVFSFV